MNTQETKFQQAKERVEEIKSFYIHLIVYVVINLMLFTINITTSPGYLWFIWPLAGWGIAVVLHAVRVYAGTLGADWEEKKITELMGDK
jgi:hypothetical protein